MPKVTKLLEMIRSLKGVVAALAVIILAQNFSVCFSVLYCVLCFCLGKAKRREVNRSINTDGQLFAVTVKLFPQKGIFTWLLSWMK